MDSVHKDNDWYDLGLKRMSPQTLLKKIRIRSGCAHPNSPHSPRTSLLGAYSTPSKFILGEENQIGLQITFLTALLTSLNFPYYNS